MLRRTLQLLVLIALVQISGIAARAESMTCREACYYSQGLCEGAGNKWEMDCRMIDPEWEGDCNLDAFCLVVD
jgi:hypothetical protein